jgi:hypothetical protein
MATRVPSAANARRASRQGYRRAIHQTPYSPQRGRPRLQASPSPRQLIPKPWFRSGTGTLSRPASASVTHLHSEFAGLSAEIARDALLAKSRSRNATSGHTALFAEAGTVWIRELHQARHPPPNGYSLYLIKGTATTCRGRRRSAMRIRSVVMPRWHRSRITAAIGVVALVVAAGVLGYIIGHGHRGSVFTVGPGILYATPSEGTAYLGANEHLNRQPTGFAYSFSPGSTWIDANGSIQQSSRPSCVSYYHAVRVKSMEAVRFPLPGGGSMGTVVWVQC